MTWDGVVRLRDVGVDDLVARFGGEGASPSTKVSAFVPVEDAGRGDLTPLLSSKKVDAAREALARGAVVLADAKVAREAKFPRSGSWVHAHAAWAMASILHDHADVPRTKPVLGEGVILGPNVVLHERVVLGDRVTVGAGAVIGSPGFGFAASPSGDVVAIPQWGGVVVGDDVHIGALSTVDAGTLAPTRIGRGSKIDAHVHVGHNVVVGERTRIAAQCGLAGSVVLGDDVLLGGQVGIADHVIVGNGARIAAKSGVIGDVPAGATFGGYPAVPHRKWLRGLAWLHRAAFHDSKTRAS
ncbi:MAG: UDP-3-O-(3-hydroxymyristoyl)glucosamine N-acyltransferase [Polyangiaceae bacterium]